MNNFFLSVWSLAHSLENLYSKYKQWPPSSLFYWKHNSKNKNKIILLKISFPFFLLYIHTSMFTEPQNNLGGKGRLVQAPDKSKANFKVSPGCPGLSSVKFLLSAGMEIAVSTQLAPLFEGSPVYESPNIWLKYLGFAAFIHCLLFFHFAPPEKEMASSFSPDLR